MMSKTPILNTLEDYLSKNPIRLHVPFHAGITNNAVLPKELYSLDISEVSGYDVDGEDNPIFQSEKVTASFFNVKHSFYLTGGASVGLLASMIALNKYGKKVILARNVHKSVVNGVVLAGLEPIWLEVDFLSEWGIFSSVNLEKLKDIIKQHNDIAGCVVVSPTYEGVISDIKSVSEICHTKNIPLIVDEAHGAHLIATSHKSQVLSYQSSILYADLVIQSWHKSLGSLTQTGVLHLVNDKYFTYNDIKRSLDLVNSTSPSFILLLSLELTRKHLAETKGEFFKGLYKNAELFREKLKKIKHLDCFENDDILKVYLRPKNITGIDFAYELYKNHSIEIESANEIGFLMQLGVNFNDAVMGKVLEALQCKPLANSNKPSASHQPPAIRHKLLIRESFMKGFRHNNQERENEIYAPCPPGYVVNVPGSEK